MHFEENYLFSLDHHETYRNILDQLLRFIDYKNEIFHFHNIFEKQSIESKFDQQSFIIDEGLKYFYQLMNLYDNHPFYYYSTHYLIYLYRVRSSCNSGGYPLQFKIWYIDNKAYFYTNGSIVTKYVPNFWGKVKRDKDDQFRTIYIK